MPIREKGYYRWDGEIKQSYIKWLPITFNGIKAAFKRKWSRPLFTVSSIPFVIFLVAVYASSKPELKMFSDLVKEIRTDALLFKSFYTLEFLVFMMLMISLFVGADLISGDLRFRSFTLYLSRPISKLDYIKGKFSIVLFYLLLFSLLPGMLLILAKIIFVGQVSFPIKVLLPAITFPIIIAMFMASLVIMFSALSANGRFIKIMFIAFYILTNMIAAVFSDAFKNDYFLYFSIEQNIKQFGSYLFQVPLAFKAPGWISGLVLLGITLISIIIVSIRLKKVEA